MQLTVSAVWLGSLLLTISTMTSFVAAASGFDPVTATMNAFGKIDDIHGNLTRISQEDAALRQRNVVGTHMDNQMKGTQEGIDKRLQLADQSLHAARSSRDALAARGQTSAAMMANRVPLDIAYPMSGHALSQGMGYDGHRHTQVGPNQILRDGVVWARAEPTNRQWCSGIMTTGEKNRAEILQAAFQPSEGGGNHEITPVTMKRDEKRHSATSVEISSELHALETSHSESWSVSLGLFGGLLSFIGLDFGMQGVKTQLTSSLRTAAKERSSKISMHATSYAVSEIKLREGSLQLTRDFIKAVTNLPLPPSDPGAPLPDDVRERYETFLETFGTDLLQKGTLGGVTLEIDNAETSSDASSTSNESSSHEGQGVGASVSGGTPKGQVSAGGGHQDSKGESKRDEQQSFKSKGSQAVSRIQFGPVSATPGTPSGSFHVHHVETLPVAQLLDLKYFSSQQYDLIHGPLAQDGSYISVPLSEIWEEDDLARIRPRLFAVAESMKAKAVADSNTRKQVLEKLAKDARERPQRIKDLRAELRRLQFVEPAFLWAHVFGNDAHSEWIAKSTQTTDPKRRANYDRIIELHAELRDLETGNEKRMIMKVPLSEEEVAQLQLNLSESHPKVRLQSDGSSDGRKATKWPSLMEESSSTTASKFDQRFRAAIDRRLQAQEAALETVREEERQKHAAKLEAIKDMQTKVDEARRRTEAQTAEAQGRKEAFSQRDTRERLLQEGMGSMTLHHQQAGSGMPILSSPARAPRAAANVVKANALIMPDTSKRSVEASHYRTCSAPKSRALDASLEPFPDSHFQPRAYKKNGAVLAQCLGYDPRLALFMKGYSVLDPDASPSQGPLAGDVIRSDLKSGFQRYGYSVEKCTDASSSDQATSSFTEKMNEQAAGASIQSRWLPLGFPVALGGSTARELSSEQVSSVSDQTNYFKAIDLRWHITLDRGATLQLTADFMHAVSQLPPFFSVIDMDIFERFFATFGTHFRRDGYLGLQHTKYTVSGAVTSADAQKTADAVVVSEADTKAGKDGARMIGVRSVNSSGERAERAAQGSRTIIHASGQDAANRQAALAGGQIPNFAKADPDGDLCLIKDKMQYDPIWTLLDYERVAMEQYHNEGIIGRHLEDLWGDETQLYLRQQALKDAFDTLSLKKRHEMHNTPAIKDTVGRAWAAFHEKKMKHPEPGKLRMKTYRGDVDAEGHPHGLGYAVFEPELDRDLLRCDRHPNGNMNAADGEYKGEWQNGRFHGAGELKQADGQIIRGNFEDGRPSGLAFVHSPLEKESAVAEYTNGELSGSGFAICDGRRRKCPAIIHSRDTGERWAQYAREDKSFIMAPFEKGVLLNGLLISPKGHVWTYDFETGVRVPQKEWDPATVEKWDAQMDGLRALRRWRRQQDRKANREQKQRAKYKKALMKRDEKAIEEQNLTAKISMMASIKAGRRHEAFRTGKIVTRLEDDSDTEETPKKRTEEA